MKDIPLRLARLAGELRGQGVATSLKDELDAAEGLMLIDLADQDELRRALRITLKIPRWAFAIFERLFSAVVCEEKTPCDRAPAGYPPTPRQQQPKGKVLRWDPETRRLSDGEGTAEQDGREPGYSSDALLRKKPFDAVDRLDLAAMERMLAELGRRLATRQSRRLVPTRRHGRPDPRASYRRALRTLGEMVSLAERARPVEKPRLVFLCDTSGSMDVHTRFLLLFVLSLRRAAPRTEAFAFNTELVHITPALARGDARHLLERIKEAVPDWSGGTRIGGSLAAFVRVHLARCVDAKTVVVVLSDGLDRGDPAELADAMRAIRRRAKKLVWLNPLLGDSRYEPTARGMEAALPFVDHFAPAHNLESLARLLPQLKG
jgi:uncharacterized protein with von Willebrand factor type A (vWA) domain